MDKFIVVAGNIGAGKSTLVQLLSERLGFQPFFEPVNDNPYLEDFTVICAVGRFTPSFTS